MNETIPSSVLHTRRNLPWLIKDTVQSMRKRNMLFKRAKRIGDYSHYKIARNKTLAQLRRAKKVYFGSLNPRDPKKFWKAVKVLNRNKQAIPTLMKDGVMAYSDSDKANMLNSFYCSCFNMSHPPLDVHSDSTQCCPDEILCSESEVCELLMSLDVSKSSGHDGISARMLKSTAYSIAPSLTKLFNLSLQLNLIPSVWNKAHVVPVPKNIGLTNPANYRPISLLPIVSKVLERHVYGILMDHLPSP